MEISATKKVQVNAKTLKLHLKVCDRFTAEIADSDNETIWEQDDGYVPDFMPGQHYGDYVILDIDLDSGQIINWEVPTPGQIEDLINAKEED